MKMTKLAVAMALGCGFAGMANAAVITKSYKVTSTFSSGPYRSIVTTFDANYDPVSTSGPVSVSNFVSGGGISFTDAEGYFLFAKGYSGRADDRTLRIGGAGNANDFGDYGDDFEINISVSNAGDVLSAGSVMYSLDYMQYVGDGSVTMPAASDPGSGGSSPVAALPEPATWAMLLVGFGMTGAAIRRRRRRPTTTFA